MKPELKEPVLRVAKFGKCYKERYPLSVIRYLNKFYQVYHHKKTKH